MAVRDVKQHFTDRFAPMSVALAHSRADGAAADWVRAWKCNSVCIGHGRRASVLPFAHEDMAVTFMDGLHLFGIVVMTI